MRDKLKEISDIQARQLIFEAIGPLQALKKVLIIHPDYTRIDCTAKLVPHILDILNDRGAQVIDFLNAGGTHRKLSEAEFLKKLGLPKKSNNVHFFNHEFDKPGHLVNIGNIPEAFVSLKTGGQLKQQVPVEINKLLFKDHDLIIALSGTSPHEACGYSGGLKIFFPGISGPQVIDLFHWAAVLIGIPNIIGSIRNPARDIVNKGAAIIFKKINKPVISFNMVVVEQDPVIKLAGLFTGKGYEGFIDAYEAAASLSSEIHIKYLKSPVIQAVQVIPQNYDEIWLAGKGSYKLQRPGVMARGGEVILYAPHIKCLHSNKAINKDLINAGYHCKEYIIDYLKSNPGLSRNAASHLINVSGPGHFKVTLATAIPQKVCREINLGYRDPELIKEEDFKKPDTIWIKDGGKYLYDLKK